MKILKLSEERFQVLIDALIAAADAASYCGDAELASEYIDFLESIVE